MNDPVPSSAISDATTGGLSLIVITGGSAGDVLTLQADGTYVAVAPAGGVSGTGSVDNAIIRANGTSDDAVQSSPMVIDDIYTASPNNTRNVVCLRPSGGTTNVSIVVSPKGDGAIIATVPDSGTAGGNSRGQWAVDLQTFRYDAANVASGQCSVIPGGLSNRASGDYSFASGIGSIASGERSAAMCNSTASGRGAFSACEANTASAWGASAVGLYSLADRNGQFAHGSGGFTGDRGQAQYSRFVLQGKTTDATPATLLLYFSTRLTIPSGKAAFLTIDVLGIKSDGSAAACYKRKVAIKNVSGTTSLIGAVETIGTDIEDNALTDVAITADNTNDALQIAVTGVASETWRWVAVVDGIEITYGI